MDKYVGTLIFQEEISFFPEDENMEELIQLVIHNLNLYGNRDKLGFNLMKVQSLSMKIEEKP